MNNDMLCVIGGELVEALTGERMENVCPATGEVIGAVPAAGAEDIDRAVEAAQEAYDNVWSKMPSAEKGRLLTKLADLIEENAETIALMDTMDMGKPIEQSRGDPLGTAAFFRYFAGLADKIEGETLVASEGYFGYTVREPYGVVGAITPWNFPAVMVGIKCAPALAAGNCAVLKPASPSPRSALEIGRLALEAGLPPGVLNVVTGPGGIAGQRLVEHPLVGKVSLTGSTEVGRRIIEASAGYIKKITLELGGKTANIIFPEADLDMAVNAAVRTIFLNCGQICTAGSRLLLHRSIKDEVLGRVTDMAQRLKVGMPTEPGTKIGPIVNQQQWDTVTRYVQSGLDQGAKLLIGGDRPSDDELQRGTFFMPTILDKVTPEMTIAQEEIFGPVLAVMDFEDEDEAIRLANATDYGLAAAIWSRNISQVQRVIPRLQAGIVWVNCTNVVGPGMPYGGYKISGLGFEGGIEGLKDFTLRKSVVMDCTEKPTEWPVS